VATPRDILGFWFSERVRPRWFNSDPAFDAEIRDNFGGDVERAQSGAFEPWRETPDTAMALVLLLDQFARNVFRGRAKAFLGDALALDIARGAVGRSFDRRFGFPDRMFFYLPFEHAENPATQVESVRLFAGLAEEFGEAASEALRYARLHQELIGRFGRFPQRNAALGRPSTEEETGFLNGPNLGF
jgi:uncharacterized protein (DUF924 family)